MKLPEPILNLYRDLRDRRMLSIAIALIAAIIAVPFLLGGSGGTDEAPPPSVATSGAPFAGDEQLDQVVLAEVPGLRDFQQRLADYKNHNPFKPQLQEPVSSNDGGGNGAASGTGGGATADGGDVPGATTPATPIDTGDSTTPTDTGNTGNTGDTGDTGSTGGDTGSNGGSQLISYRIDVRVGPVGHTKVYKDVPQLTFLPDKQHPLVDFVDADLSGSQVAFIVNPGAAALKGDAKCVRNDKDCQYLVMSPKDEKTFLFEDQQYRIQLLSINEHREPYDPNATGDDTSGASGGSGGSGRSGSSGDSGDAGDDGPSSRGVSSLLGG